MKDGGITTEPGRIEIEIQVRISADNTEENKTWVEELSKELLVIVGAGQLKKPPAATKARRPN
jgi:hypothetical protein